MIPRVAVQAFFLIAGIALFYRVAFWLQGYRLSSWYRTPWRNTEVGGVSNSLHLLGWAFDVVPGGPATVVKLKTFPLPLRVVLDEGNHVHCQIV